MLCRCVLTAVLTCWESLEQARFLAIEEREWLHKRNAQLGAEAVSQGAATLTWPAILSLRTWHLAAISLVANVPKCELRSNLFLTCMDCRICIVLPAEHL